MQYSVYRDYGRLHVFSQHISIEVKQMHSVPVICRQKFIFFDFGFSLPREARHWQCALER
jgi:hypothetical protein